KLEFCDRTMAALAGRDPVVTADELEEDVGTLDYSVEQFYEAPETAAAPFPPGIDTALRSIFEDLGDARSSPVRAPRRMASALIARLERDLLADVYRWTGHFPERTRPLLRHLSERADAMVLVYPEGHEIAATVAVTTLVTALAMNHVHKGKY